MITRIKSKQIITPKGFFDGYLYIDPPFILDITDKELPFDKQIDATEEIVSPGLIDMHIHGGLGFDFSQCDKNQVAEIIDFHLSHGTTGIYPTILSVDNKTLCRALDNIRYCKENGLCKGKILGVHLEGPYFSPSQSGAQAPDVISPPKKEQYEMILRDYGDLVKRWSYAPELDENAAFARYLKAHNVVAAIGHSDAVYDDCISAYNAGCKLVTHLYSCTSTITRKNGFRRLGVIETAYLLDDMAVEIIADGKHLPPELIRLIYKIKGDNAICLVTDAISAAGDSNKNPIVSGMKCVVEDGVAKLPDRTAFAGSIATADVLLKTCVKDAGIPLLSAVKMMTETPANVMGIDAGVLKKGAVADIVIFNNDITVQKVFASGIPV